VKIRRRGANSKCNQKSIDVSKPCRLRSGPMRSGADAVGILTVGLCALWLGACGGGSSKGGTGGGVAGAGTGGQGGIGGGAAGTAGASAGMAGAAGEGGHAGAGGIAGAGVGIGGTDAGVANLSTDGGGDANADGGLGCVPPPTGLVAWYPGEGNANDVVGGNNGTFSGGYAAGEVGDAFSISSTKYVTVPDNPALNPEYISVEVWVRRDATSGVADPIVKKASEGTSQVHGYSLEFGNGGSTSALEVLFAVYTGGAATGAGAPAGWQATPGKVVANGSWAHVVGVYDGAKAELFVNGTSAGSVAATGPIVASGNSLDFGRDPGNVTSRAFQGLVDEVSIYNRPLSATEIVTLYDAGKGGKCH
jgi:hypothetical protein